MIINKINQTQKITPVCIVSMLASSLLFISSAHSAPQVIVTPNTASSTIIEQTSDGQVATITTTPTSISMQSGMPYSVTQVTNVPRYTVRQNGVLQSNTKQVVVSQSNVINTGTTVTTLPINTLPLNTIPVTNQVTSVGIVTTPVNSVAQALPVTTLPVTTLPITTLPITTLPITNNNAIAVTTTTSLDTLQLKPVFSTPNVVAANTKVMKILKNREGREFAVPANHIAPGDIIEYHTVYTNTTARPVNDINATVNLPNGVKLLSLNSSLPTLATTGGNTYQAIGQVGTSTVIQQPYSGLKWNLVDLGANAAQTVVIRATVQ